MDKQQCQIQCAVCPVVESGLQYHHQLYIRVETTFDMCDVAAVLLLWHGLGLTYFILLGNVNLNLRVFNRHLLLTPGLMSPNAAYLS